MTAYTRPSLRRAGLLAAFALIIASGCEIVEEGPPGPPGNANVFSIPLVFSMDDAIINGNVASVQYEVRDLTPRLVEEGAVLLYFYEEGTWTAAPFTFGVESADLPAVDYTVTLGYGFEARFLEVFYEASTDAVDLRALPDLDLKVVVIDGFFAKSEVDLSDYEAVKTHFNLEN